jgi:type I restriction enzyme S subunit
MPATHKPLIDVRPDHWAIVRDILQKHVPQFEVWAFGSRAKWSAKEYSDLDLAVITDRPLSISTSAALADDLAESDLPWKVDVVDWATTAESFRKIIARDKVVVQRGAGMSEWRQFEIGRAFDVNPSRAIQRGKVTPFIPMDALPEHARSAARIDEREFTGSGTKFQNGDTLVARITPCLENGKTAFISGLPDGVVAHGSTEYIVLAGKPNQSDNLFAYYLARSPDFRQYAIGHMEGTSGRQRVPSIAVEKYLVSLPSLQKQRAIAHILGTFDDKIELNRRMNETLEAIARAKFKSWFVDFDPVRAKMSGEPSESICQRLGLTPDLLALFPDRLVDSELGEIPEGWDVKPLDVVADYLNGLALQKFPPESETEWLPVIKISQLKKGDTSGADRASCNLKPEYIVNDGDVIFSWSGSLEVDIWCGGRGALNQHLFKVTSANYPKWFYYQWTKHHLASFQAIASGKAVTMGHIQRKHLTQALCAVPQKPLMGKLDDIMATLLEKQIENRKASRTLAMVRDELLPKLLSGRLRVSEADSSVEVYA